MPCLSTSCLAITIQPMAGLIMTGTAVPANASNADGGIILANVNYAHFGDEIEDGLKAELPTPLPVAEPLTTMQPIVAFIPSPPVEVATGDTSREVVVPSANEGEIEEQAPAATLEDIYKELKKLREEVQEQRRVINLQQSEINNLRRNQIANFELESLRGAGAIQDQTGTSQQATTPPNAASSSTTQEVEVDIPSAPVGEAPPERERPSERATVIVPEGQGVLTPRGSLTLDSSFTYTSSSTNRLVFRGIELVPGIQIGLIEASDADRDTLAGSIAARYGITNRIELEARVPVLYRSDRIQVAQQRDEGIVRQIKLQDEGIGDIEFAVRYQANERKAQNPIWIAGLRVKSDTGQGPFDVDFDEFGVATGLATGSGFWGIQPSVNMILPSDPAVIFGGISFLYHLPRNIDRIVGEAEIGRVDPGDAASANLGFGFALNPRFSFSLGYRHSYIFPTETEIGGAIERSSRTQVGSFTFGMSYRLTEKTAVNFGIQVGATADAPDLGVTFRIPLRIGN